MRVDCWPLARLVHTALGLHETGETGHDPVGVAITASPEETGEILDERHKAAGGSDDGL